MLCLPSIYVLERY